MPDMECLSVEEQNAIRELSNRVKSNLTSPALNEDSSLFYRFLKARDFDVDKAEKMLIKHIEWRKVYQVDMILETFKPKEVFPKYIEPRLVGLDKEGNIVRYSGSAGKLNNAEIIKCFTFHDYIKHWIWFSEKNVSLTRQQAEETGKVANICFIVNLDRLEFANATSKITSDILLRFAQLLQENYPERMKSIYIINAPFFFVFVFTMLKAVVSNAMIKKMHIFGYSGWKEKLLEVIDADVLPEFLGGKRTDPEEDHYCRYFINIPGNIWERYYLSEEERYFKDSSRVTTTTIYPLEKRKLFVHVEEPGSLIQCKFMVRNKSIGFGLFFQESQNVIKEIIPMHEYDTSDGAEDNSYKCVSKGNYFIIFDNASRFSTKQLEYILSVKKSEI